MRRRDFIKVVAGSAIPRPLAVRAQQPEQVRRIGVLSNKSSGDVQGREEAAAFAEALKTHGWISGGNVQIDYRWGAGDGERYRTYAAELVAQAPDALLAVGGTVVGALQRLTRDIPIVFVATSDPVNRGLVASLSRPGGNTTGFLLFEYSICGKWLELLKEIAPHITRVAVIRVASEFSGVGEFAAIQAVAPSLGVDLSPIDPRDSAAMERAVIDFAHQSNSGLIVTESGASIKDRDRIASLWRRSSDCRQSMLTATSPLRAASSRMGPTKSTSTAAPRITWIEFSRERNRLSYRCRRRPNLSWRSISRLRKRSASPSRRRCWRAPTR